MDSGQEGVGLASRELGCTSRRDARVRSARQAARASRGRTQDRGVRTIRSHAIAAPHTSACAQALSPTWALDREGWRGRASGASTAEQLDACVRELDGAIAWQRILVSAAHAPRRRRPSHEILAAAPEPHAERAAAVSRSSRPMAARSRLAHHARRLCRLLWARHRWPARCPQRACRASRCVWRCCFVRWACARTSRVCSCSWPRLCTRTARTSSQTVRLAQHHLPSGGSLTDAARSQRSNSRALGRPPPPTRLPFRRATAERQMTHRR